jgi:hypothetical protein
VVVPHHCSKVTHALPGFKRAQFLFISSLEVMSDSFKVLLNDGQVCEVSREQFGLLPEDSFLYNLLKEDQMMSTKNEQGQYLLTLDYPQLFKVALQCVSPDDESWKNYSIWTKDLGMNLGDSMRALASTLNYLGIPVPLMLADFQEEANSFFKDLGRIIIREAEKQMCDVALRVHSRMVQKEDLFLRQCWDLVSARDKNLLSVRLELGFSVKLNPHRISLSFEGSDKTDEGFDKTDEESDKTDEESEDYDDEEYYDEDYYDEDKIINCKLDCMSKFIGKENCFYESPLMLLAKRDNEAFLELVQKHLVSVVVSTFCNMTDTYLESQKVVIARIQFDRKIFDVNVALKLILDAEGSNRTGQPEEMYNR